MTEQYRRPRSIYDALYDRHIPETPMPTIIHTTSDFKAAAEELAPTEQNLFKRNMEFMARIENGGTVYDGYGTPVFQTSDRDVILAVLEATNDRHNGVYMTGIRPL